MTPSPRLAISTHLDRIRVIPVVPLPGPIDVAQISPSVTDAGDDSLPVTARHQGGWTMRKHEIAVGAASHRVAAHDMQTSRTFVVPASAADAASRLTQDAPTDARESGSAGFASGPSPWNQTALTQRTQRTRGSGCDCPRRCSLLLTPAPMARASQAPPASRRPSGSSLREARGGAPGGGGGVMGPSRSVSPNRMTHSQTTRVSLMTPPPLRGTSPRFAQGG